MAVPMGPPIACPSALLGPGQHDHDPRVLDVGDAARGCQNAGFHRFVIGLLAIGGAVAVAAAWWYLETNARLDLDHQKRVELWERLRSGASRATVSQRGPEE